MISSRMAALDPCCSKWSRCARAQSRGMNELPASASLRSIWATYRTGSPPSLPVTTTSPVLVFASGQITADQNLLRAGGDLGQHFGIDGRHLDAAEFDLQIAQTRLGDFVEQFFGDGLRRLLAVMLRTEPWPTAAMPLSTVAS